MTASTLESGKSIPHDVVLSALANEHRRAVLRSLNQTEGAAMQVSALVDQVAERVLDGESPDDDHRQRVHTALHHIHLPKLEACGMIVRDTEMKPQLSSSGRSAAEMPAVLNMDRVMSSSIDSDTVLGLCADQHRRIALAVLANEQRSLTRNDLTKAIAKHNHHVPVTEMPKERLSEVQISLHHVHLPKIEAAGLVNYDQERGLVEPTEQFEEVQPQLSALFEADLDLESPVEL